MIGKFIQFGILFVIAAGLVLHFDVDVPYFSSWIGHLPGDLILKKGKATIYLPFTTGAILSAGLSLLGSLFTNDK